MTVAAYHSSTLRLFSDFAHHTAEVEPGLHIHAVVGGSGPPLLLLHGHPQTLAIWHKVAPAPCANAYRGGGRLARLRRFGKAGRYG